MLDDDPVDFETAIGAQTALVRDLDAATRLFGRSISEAFSKGVVEGRKFEDVLKGIALKLSQGLVRQALKPVEAGLGSLLGEGVRALGGVFGGFGGTGPVQAFAQGGIVGQPTYFGLGRGLGLMGEAGAEAILPLARGADGRLGVRAGGASSGTVNVTIQIATPDAESFRRSEGQVSAAVARAVARGQRAL
jgi:phage-related minor tail protein